MLLRGDKAGGRRWRGTFLHLGHGDKNITGRTVTPSPSLAPAGDPRHGGTGGVSAECPLPRGSARCGFKGMPLNSLQQETRFSCGMR